MWESLPAVLFSRANEPTACFCGSSVVGWWPFATLWIQFLLLDGGLVVVPTPTTFPYCQYVCNSRVFNNSALSLISL